MGLKRARDWDDDEYEEFIPRKKRLKVENTSRRGRSEQRELKSRPRLRRSNSIGRNGELLSISDRHTSNTSLKKEGMKDYSVITVFSREAFENFGKKWKSTMSVDDTLSLATSSSRKGVSDSDVKKMLSLQSKSILGTDFQAQVQALLENKTMPHIIAVIEGKEEMASLQLKANVDGQSLDVPYSRVEYIQGKNAKGSLDNKQSMSIYVRSDMMGVYSFTEEFVTHSSGKTINAIGANYATEDGTNYRSLIVHIPNEFIGSKSKELATHASFQKYAVEQGKKTSPVVVTSYFGDTNYSSAMSDFSRPSMGGHLSSGETLNPQSSGAKKETHFMQSVPLQDGHSKHSVLQPSTTNYVFINPDSANREATDHPSITQYAAHDSELAGKTKGSPLAPLDVIME